MFTNAAISAIMVVLKLQRSNDMTRAEIKQISKQRIHGNIAVLFLIALVISLIIGAANMLPVIGSIAAYLLLQPAFTMATTRIYVNMAYDPSYKPTLSDAFSCFNDFWSVFKVTFLVNLFTMLWSLLFVIPGIIKSYSYSQAIYIISENPKMGALEAITMSRRMMDGHKLELFVLELSFIGWVLLSPLTCGILLIWLMPYRNMTLAGYYVNLKSKFLSEQERLY